MKEKKFILLPAKGMLARTSENPHVDPNVTDFLTTLSGHTRSAKPFSMKTERLTKPLPIKVLDSVHEDGAKLVQIDPDKISDFHMAYPGLRIIPEVFLYKMVMPHQQLAPGIKKLAAGKTVKIKFVDKNGKGVPGAMVVAFTDFENGQGAQGKTSSSGLITLKFSAGTKSIERLYVYPVDTYWPLLKKNVKLNAPGLEIEMTSIDQLYPDALDFFYKKIADKPITNNTIKVGVLDTGVGPHKDIELSGGECTVEGEHKNDFKDYDGHETHVAGIISSFAKTQNNLPAIEIYSFRVFPKNGGGASNYSIAKAIDRAVESGCLLINMSLGGGDPDDATKDAITDAQSKGVICFVATGNDDRGPVSFPASFSLSMAVGAMGRKETFPKDSEPNDCVKAPFGKDKKNFIASFSNIGPEVDLIGPGVGIVSCAPNNKFAVMNGTSMACPAAAGIAARLLIDEGNIINQPPDANRANSMIKFLTTRVKSLGFTPRYEGRGMIL